MLVYKPISTGSIFFTPLSLEQQRNKINRDYLMAKNSFIAYKTQMLEIYHLQLDIFVENLDALHIQARVPTAALIIAFEKRKGF